MAAALIDKIPPHNDEFEKAVLGALFLDKEAIDVAFQYLRAEDFYSIAHGRIYNAILKLYNEGNKTTDIISVVQELRQSSQLDACGGEPYIAGLTNVIPTSANIEYYAKIVRENSMRRTIIHTASEMTRLAYDETRETRAMLEEAEQKIFELSDKGQTFSYKGMDELIPIAIDLIDARRTNKSEYTGVPSGYDELDRLTLGFQNSDLIILAARPSIGKTALAMNMAAYVSIHKHIPVGFLSLEMTNVSLVTRLIAAEAKIDSYSLRNGFFKSSDYERLTDAAGRIYESPFFIVDKPNMSLLDVRSQARRLRSKKKVEIIFIDYLQLISLDRYNASEYETVSEISRSLKSLARELEIPVVALSQLNRGNERESKMAKPNLASLRGSGSIEQDADLVMFLHRENRGYEKGDGQDNQEKPEAIETELILAKQRNGNTGNVTLEFKPMYAQFVPKERGG
jgi:replicative DNA helicase